MSCGRRPVQAAAAPQVRPSVPVVKGEALRHRPSYVKKNAIYMPAGHRAAHDLSGGTIAALIIGAVLLAMALAWMIVYGPWQPDVHPTRPRVTPTTYGAPR